jgi:hypothetical protein
LNNHGKLAWVFVRGLNNEQRKQLGVLVNHVDGVDGLEDEVPSALHDQACEGDKEAFEVLQWDEKTVERIVNDAVKVYEEV